MMGQMISLSDSYLYNGHAINPAFMGSQDALSATMVYRNQWVGFEGAPKNQLLSIHAPLLNDRIGVGLQIDNQSIGIFNRTAILGNYAYRIQLQRGILAMGLGFGVSIYNNAWNELEVSDETDENLLNNPTTAVIPALSFGTYYYTRKYYIGFSLPFYLSDNMNQYAGEYKIKPDFSGYNYFLTGGYQLEINSDVKLLPSLLVRYQPKNDLQIDWNFQVSLKEMIWLGIGYRNKNMLIGTIQCQINYQVRVAYSYEFILGNIGSYLNGSHEIGLNYIFRYKRSVNGPRKF
jgi:type IX secretion system PorP/SprF family membrane protein